MKIFALFGLVLSILLLNSWAHAQDVGFSPLVGSQNIQHNIVDFGSAISDTEKLSSDERLFVEGAGTSVYPSIGVVDSNNSNDMKWNLGNFNEINTFFSSEKIVGFINEKEIDVLNHDELLMEMKAGRNVFITDNYYRFRKELGYLNEFGNVAIKRELNPDDAVDFLNARLEWDRREVDADAAMGHLNGILLKEQKLVYANVQTELSRQDEIDQRAACGASVKVLRKYRTEIPNGDFLEGYTAVCLSGLLTNGDFSPNSEELKRAKACQAAYENYASSCYAASSDQDPSLDLRPFTGVLVWRADPSSERFIICSGAAVGQFHILTARHCIKLFEKASPNSELTFHMFLEETAQSASEPVFSIIAVRTAPEFERVEINELVATKLADVSKSDDMVLLETDNAIPLPEGHTRFPQVSRGYSWQNTTLIAYQPLVGRLYELNSLLKEGFIPTRETVVKTGAWRRSMVADASAHCRIISLDEVKHEPNVVGHQCQSWESSSGAPLVALDPLSHEPIIVAVHSHVAGTKYPESPEAKQTRNLAVLPDEAIAEHIKAAEDEIQMR